jgi:hypothetical protein
MVWRRALERRSICSSMNVLRTWDTLLAFIRGTTATSGLAVKAVFQPGDYPLGQTVSDAEMDALNLGCPVVFWMIR